MDGIIQIGGQNFTERWQVLPFEQAITTLGQVINPISVPLPGTYAFLLKAITRQTLVAGVATERRFKVRFGNTDGGIWYSQAGRGGTTDRVLDSLICGDAALPYVVIPAIFYSPNSSIYMEVEDVSGVDTDYTIYFAFHGSFLVPA